MVRPFDEDGIEASVDNRGRCGSTRKEEGDKNYNGNMYIFEI